MNFDSTKPPTPAIAAWAREICPTNPVRITNDSMMTVITMLVMTPNR